jgi:ribulose-phosphate 3-epimerase
MAVICPTVLATDEADYAQQMQRITSFAERLQIDLADGEFAKNKTVDLDDIWWPMGLRADIHLMYQNPFDHIDKLLNLKPAMVIVHVESTIHHMHFAAELHKEGIKAGLAVLPETPISNIEQIIHSFDHLLIFSGNLGHFGGEADLGLLEKVNQAKEHHPDIEIGWDGGINDQNAKNLADGGVDVLNVGGFIQKAENPRAAYKLLVDSLS